MGAIPDSWSGSRVPDLQTLLDKLNDWTVDRSQVVLARAIAEAMRRLGKDVERERERERLDDELMAWS